MHRGTDDTVLFPGLGARRGHGIPSTLITRSVPGEPSFWWSFAADSAIHCSETRIRQRDELLAMSAPIHVLGRCVESPADEPEVFKTRTMNGGRRAHTADTPAPASGYEIRSSRRAGPWRTHSITSSALSTSSGSSGPWPRRSWG